MLKEYLAKKAKEFLMSTISEAQSNIKKEVSSKIVAYKRKIVRELIVLFIILVAIILLACALVFILIEYSNLTKALAFGIVGIVFIFVGFMIKRMK